MSASHTALASTASTRKPSLFWTVVWGYLLLTIFIGFVLIFIGKPALRFESAELLREQERIKIRDEVLAAAQKELEAPPAWINKEKGVVHLPIKDAMVLTIDRLNLKKPRAANPIEAAPVAAPAAAPNAATPNAATPAPAAAPNPPAAPAATPATPK